MHMYNLRWLRIYLNFFKKFGRAFFPKFHLDIDKPFIVQAEISDASTHLFRKNISVFLYLMW
jgi:hypothetical protein